MGPRRAGRHLPGALCVCEQAVSCVVLVNKTNGF